MEKALVSLLLSDTDILNTIGKTGVSPSKRDKYPSITYNKDGFDQATTIDGGLEGIARTSYTISVWAKDYLTAKDIASYVKRSLKPPYSTELSTRVLLAQLTDASEEVDPEQTITEISLSYTITHEA